VSWFAGAGPLAGTDIDKRGEVARPTSGWTGERTSRAAPD